MAKEMSVAEYAAHCGVSREMIYKRERTGKLTRLPNGKIDPDAADAQWAQLRDVLQAERSAGQKQPHARRRSAAPINNVASIDQQPAPAQSGPSFLQLQVAEKSVKIQAAQLKLKREQGQILDAAETRRTWSGLVVRAREILTQIGPELQDSLAIETDPVKCRDMIDSRIHQALSMLASYVAA